MYPPQQNRQIVIFEDPRYRTNDDSVMIASSGFRVIDRLMCSYTSGSTLLGPLILALRSRPVLLKP